MYLWIQGWALQKTQTGVGEARWGKKRSLLRGNGLKGRILDQLMISKQHLENTQLVPNKDEAADSSSALRAKRGAPGC